MKQVQELLLEGQGEAARRRLATLLAQEPAKAAAVADIITNILWTAYEQFHIQAVHDFCRDMAFDMPAVVADRIQQALGPRIQQTMTWSLTLRSVTRERLVRECRDAVIRKDLKKAALCGATLLERARDESELDDSSLLLARGLATLQRDREHALTVIGYLMKAGTQTRQAAPIVADQFTQMSREFKTVSFANDARDWVQYQTEALLSFRSVLPGPMEVGEPEVAQLETFYEAAHALLRAGLHHRNRDDAIDALAILLEYCPADPPTIKNVAGVEERMFLKLGPRAKLTAVRALTKLGELELLRQSVNSLARESGLERIKLLTAIMGGLRHPEFYPWLHQMLGKVDNRRDEALVIEGLGRIGNPDAARLLLGLLESALKKSTDPVHEQRAYLLLTALGRIGRARGLDPKVRGELVRKVTKLTDHADRQLGFHAAGEMFSVRLDELDGEQKDWAAQKAVDALWGQPQALPDTPSVNGWREPMVATLKRLGPAALPAVLTAAARHASRYCGAMGALANALEEIGDESAVPLLEGMLRTALLHQEDPKQSKPLEEKTVDAATRQIRSLDRDDLVHSILFTLKKIGGDAGIKVILDCADQVQGGRLTPPGQQTINFLLDVKLKLGRLELRPAEAVARAVDEKALKQALAHARGGLLTRKATQIAAIAQLGQLQHPAGVPVLLELLGEKDAMIASAAHTALAQFLMPLPGEKPYREFLDSMLEHPELLKGRAMERFMDFVARELPKNPPYDKLLDRQVEIMIEDGELAHRIRGAFRRPKDKDVIERLKTESVRDPAAAEGDSGEDSVFIDDDRLARQSGLDKRRQFFEARQAWLRGGKVGAPPKPPQ